MSVSRQGVGTRGGQALAVVRVAAHLNRVSTHRTAALHRVWLAREAAKRGGSWVWPRGSSQCPSRPKGGNTEIAAAETPRGEHGRGGNALEHRQQPEASICHGTTRASGCPQRRADWGSAIPSRSSSTEANGQCQTWHTAKERTGSRRRSSRQMSPRPPPRVVAVTAWRVNVAVRRRHVTPLEPEEFSNPPSADTPEDRAVTARSVGVGRRSVCLVLTASTGHAP